MIKTGDHQPTTNQIDTNKDMSNKLAFRKQNRKHLVYSVVTAKLDYSQIKNHSVLFSQQSQTRTSV
jgi:hypothetical protein